jgi:hypothetical protein
MHISCALIVAPKRKLGITCMRDKKFSGYGHRVGNLLPCCKLSNSKKGNKDWRVFLSELRLPEPLRKERENRIDSYITKYCIIDTIPEHLPEYQQLQELRCQVLGLFSQANALANAVRSKSADLSAECYSQTTSQLRYSATTM